MARDTGRETRHSSAAQGEEKTSATMVASDSVTKKSSNDHRVARKVGWLRPAILVPIAITLIAAIAAIVFAFRPGVHIDNQAMVDEHATNEVATAAASNAQRLVAIDYRSLDRYHDSLGEILTPTLQEQFEKDWDTLKQTYIQTESVVQAEVSDVAVTYLEDERAEALVAQHVTWSRGGKPVGETVGTYILTLERTDGVWKLASIPDLPQQ